MPGENINKSIWHTSATRYLFYFLLLYFIGFCLLNLTRLWGFGFAIGDFGLFRQLIWNTLHGRFFQYSILYPFDAKANYIGYHFTILPVIAALPFYALFPYPETLCILHVFLVSVPAVVIYLTCIKLDRTYRESIFWALAYLLNPITIYHDLFSYAEMSYAPLLISLGIYFTVARKFRSLILSCLFLLLVKEQYGASVFGFGLLWIIYNKSWREGLILCIGGAISLFAIIFGIMPEFRTYHANLMLEKHDGMETMVNYKRYQWLNGPLLETIKILPGKIFSLANIKFYNLLFIPTMLLPFGGLIFLLPSLGDLLAIILSDNPVQKTVTLNYPPAIVPSLVIASCYTLKRISNQKIRKCIFILFSGVVLYCAIDVMRPPLDRLSLLGDKQMDWAFGKDFEQAIAHLPSDKFVITDEGTGTILSDRENISGYNQSAVDKAEYVFIRLNTNRYFFTNFINVYNDIDSTKNMLNSPSYGLIYWQFPYAIFQKGAKNTGDVGDLKQFLKTQYYVLKLIKAQQERGERQ